MKHFAKQNTCPIFHWDTVVINGQCALLILRTITLYTFSIVLTQNDRNTAGTCNICRVECAVSVGKTAKLYACKVKTTWLKFNYILKVPVHASFHILCHL
jgi:hypothetical protein